MTSSVGGQNIFLSQAEKKKAGITPAFEAIGKARSPQYLAATGPPQPKR
jgi:hypothetical protein